MEAEVVAPPNIQLLPCNVSSALSTNNRGQDSSYFLTVYISPCISILTALSV